MTKNQKPSTSKVAMMEELAEKLFTESGLKLKKGKPEETNQNFTMSFKKH